MNEEGLARYNFEVKRSKTPPHGHVLGGSEGLRKTGSLLLAMARNEMDY